MVQYQTLRVPDQEYMWIESSLKRDLLRFPKFESFTPTDLRRLIVHWDDIFVRWLRRFYRPIGIEVVHEPEDSYPIHFRALPKEFERLPGYDVEQPGSLDVLDLDPERAQLLVQTYGPEGVVKEYLVKRFSELSTVSEAWPPPS